MVAKSKILVVGAGLAGLPAAFSLKRALQERAEVAVLNPRDAFHFVPSNPWIAVGWRTTEQTSVPLGPTLSGSGIGFVQDSLARLDAANRRAHTAAGEKLDYDYCVLATGPELAFDAVPGLDPASGHCHSICTSAHAVRCHQAFQDFLQSPGPIVVGAVQGASCFGPAYEFAFILDYELRQRGLRERAPMLFVTSEPYVGHLGVGGIDNSRELLENALNLRGIRFMVNARVDQIADGSLTVTEHDTEGQPVRTSDLPTSFSMLIPPFRGIAAIDDSQGVGNANGFVLIDAFQRNPVHPEIFAAGVSVAIPPVEKTPVPTGAPKTGYMIESMVAAITENIRLAMEGQPPEAQGSWNALCLADMGDSGAAFLAMPQNPPRAYTWVNEGRWVRVSKVMFEKYFLRKMRRGRPEPGYERFLMRMLGIHRLKQQAGP